MASSYGYLNRHVVEGRGTAFKGAVDVLGTELFGDIALIEIEKRGENSPSHDVKIKGRQGQWVTLGKAWTKKLNNPPYNEFFSITLDAPMMAKPINLTAFPMDDKAQPEGWSVGDKPIAYDVVWTRPRKQSSMANQSAEQSVDDDIPF